MRTVTHHLVGAATALCFVAVAPSADGTHVAGFVAVAMVTAGGPLSPDVDNQPAWKATVGRIWRGFAHRRITHWWGLPVAAGCALSVVDVAPMTEAAGWGMVVGWASHIAGDFVFGRAAVGRGPGVPMLPTRWHLGAGLKSDGATERVVCWVMGIVAPVLACVVVARGVTDAFR